jgi:hypothetical protein
VTGQGPAVRAEHVRGFDVPDLIAKVVLTARHDRPLEINQ